MKNIKLKNNKIQFSKTHIIVSGSLGKIKYIMPKNFFLLNSNSFYLKKSDLFFFYNLLKFLLNSVNYGWHFEFNIGGKGFKLFEYNKYLAFDLGYSSLFLFKNKNKSIKIFTLKKKLIFYSIFKEKIFNLIHVFKSFYHFDKYHQKGLTFKNDKKRYIYKKLM